MCAAPHFLPVGNYVITNALNHSLYIAPENEGSDNSQIPVVHTYASYTWTLEHVPDIPEVYKLNPSSGGWILVEDQESVVFTRVGFEKNVEWLIERQQDGPTSHGNVVSIKWNFNTDKGWLGSAEEQSLQVGNDFGKFIMTKQRE